MGKKILSIKISKDNLEKLINNLRGHKKLEILPKSKSEYEIFRAKLNDSLLIVYSSGTITFHVNEEIEKIVNKYTSTPQKEKKKFKPIRAQLTKDQLIAFEKKLEIFAKKEKPKGMGERATFRFEESNIILYHKGTVYSPKGNEKFKQTLLDVFKEIPAYTDFDIMIGQDEVGKGEMFGPLVVGSVALTEDQIIGLQIEGIRDSKSVENKDIERLANLIKNNSVVWCTKHAGTDVFNKRYEEFKNESKTINDFLAWTHSIAIEESLKQLDNLELGNKRILLIIDEFDRIKTDERIAKKIIDRNIKVIQTPRAELQSIAVAASSIIAKNRRNQLVKDIEDEIGMTLNIENIDDILVHSLSSKALKLSYVRSMQKKGTVPIPETTIRGSEVDDLLSDLILRSDLECESLDFKEKFPDDASRIGKTICAMSNTEGGNIFFGITDKDKKLVGIKDIQKTEERIQGLQASFVPNPLIKFTKLVNSKNLEFLRAEISNAKDEPIAFRDKYYIRKGSTNKGISPKEMRELWDKKSNEE